MPAFSDWGSLADAIVETVARSRLLEVARKNLGLSRSLPESAAIDAAIIEAVTQPGTGIPVVADDAARDVRFGVTPAGDQLALVKAKGRIDRFDQAANKWFSEGVTRAAGPTITARAKGAKGDDAADDYQSFADAEAAAVASGGMHEIDLGTYRIGSDLALTSFRHTRGGILKPLSGKKITVTGYIRAGRQTIFDLSLGGTVDLSGCTNAEIYPEWFKDVNRTLPVPCSYPSGLPDTTPGLVEQIPPQAGAGVAGHTNEAAYTYFGVPSNRAGFDGGETIPSAVTQWPAVQSQEHFAVEVQAPSGYKGVGWGGYFRDVTAAGTLKRMELVPFGEGVDVNRTYKQGFGDCSPANDGNGVLGTPYASGSAPPGANTAKSATGIVLQDPTAAGMPAPRVYRKCGIAPNQRYYVKYCYVAADGTEGPLSPVAKGLDGNAGYLVPNDAKGHCLLLFIKEHTPGGACFLRVYASTDNINYHRQGVRYYQGVSGVPSAYLYDYPAGQKSVEIHEFDATTPAPVAGTAISLVGGIQQAWEAVQTFNQMGSRTIKLSKHYDIFCPLSLYSSLGPMDVGTMLDGCSRGTMGGGGNGTVIPGTNNGAGTFIHYNGPAGGTHVVWQSAWSVMRNINFGDSAPDPGNASVRRVKQSLHMVDPWGDTCFWNVIEGCTFRAYGAKGIALLVDARSSSASGHTASENTFVHTSFYGNDWGISFSQNQTANFRFYQSLFECNAATGSEGAGASARANSGDIRISASVHKFVDCTGSGNGHYTFFLSSDNAIRGNGTSPNVSIYEWSGEVHTLTCMHFIYLSNYDHFRPAVFLTNSELTSIAASGGMDDYIALYVGSWARVVAPLCIFRNYVVIDNFGATFDAQGSAYPTDDLFRLYPRFSSKFPQGAKDLPARLLVGSDGYLSPAGTLTTSSKLSACKGARPGACANGASITLGVLYVKGARKAQSGLLIADAVTEIEYSQSKQGLFLWGEITADDYVTVFASNATGGAITLTPGTVTVTVVKRWVSGSIPLDPAATSYAFDAPNRADSAVSMGSTDSGLLWSVISGGGGISSKRIYFPVGGDGFGAKAIVDTTHADAIISADFDETANVGFGGVLLARVVDNNNYFALILDQDWGLWKVNAGVGSLPINIVNAKFRSSKGKAALRLIGDYIQILQDGVPIGEVQDAFNVGVTKHGVGARNTQTYITNFSVTA